MVEKKYDIDKDLERTSEELSRLYDLKIRITEQYDSVKEHFISLMKKKKIKRTESSDKYITMTSEERTSYEYSILKDKIEELDLFDKVVKTSINRDALEREIESGNFPAKLAKQASKTKPMNRVLVNEKEKE